MPELPEVEAVCGVVRRALAGRTIVSGRVLRRRICLPQTPTQLARAVANRRFLSAGRLGKNILIHLEGVTLLIHLRMTGNLYAIAGPRLRVHSVSAYFTLDNGRALVFDDPRGLGVLRAIPSGHEANVLGEVGVDPLSAEFTARRFIELARQARRPVKVWLLDQRPIAGIGNIYSAEALYRARIDPRRRASGLSAVRLRRLHAAIVRMLRRAVKSAVLAYQSPGRFAGGESFDPAVYGREGLPCRRCGRRIRRIQQGGRSTYFCPGCQT